MSLCGIQILVTYILYLGEVFESLKKVLRESKISGLTGFSFCAIEPIRKDGNDGKLPIWLNAKLFYCSVFFKTIDYLLFERASFR